MSNRYVDGPMYIVCGTHGLRYSASRRACPSCANDTDRARLGIPNEQRSTVSIVPRGDADA